MMIYGILALLVLLAVIFGFVALLVFLFRKLIRPGSKTMTTEDTSGSKRPLLVNQTLTIRVCIVAVIALLMLIPLAMMQSVVDERNGLYQNVLYDIANTWGGQQLLQGPMLVVPFVEKHVSKETTTDESGEEKVKTKINYVSKYAVHLPAELNIDVELSEQHRKRGIYKSLVYEADISLSGNFDKIDVNSLSDYIHRIDWDKTYLILGMSDTRAINHVSELNWNNDTVGYSPGTKLTNLISHGFHASLSSLDENTAQHNFSTKISINGSQGFRFTPFGEVTNVNMKSSWPHPSFQGMTLPTKYEINDDGFTSSWSIPHLARNFPQSWVAFSSEYNLSEFTAGVDLFEPVFLYSKVTRAVKYGILFIGLTFLTFLIFELTTQARLHFVQYGLIGIALALFYLVLLSVAEHASFLKAYVIAACINIGLITLYTAAVLRNWSKSAMILVLLAALYTVLYSLLQLEDYALLMGTMLLLSVLIVLMYVTRNLSVKGSAVGASVSPSAKQSLGE